MYLTLAAIPKVVFSELRLALLLLGLLLGGFFVILLLLAIRRSTINHAALDRTGKEHKQPSLPTDAWAEAGRRLQLDSGASRLDDTVDLDPFDRG